MVLDGISIMVALLSCGEEAVSSGLDFWEILKPPSTRILLWTTSLLMISLGMQFTLVRKVGVKLYPKLLNLESLRHAFLRPLHFTTVTDQRNYLLTSFKLKETILERTLTSYFPNLESICIQTGPELVETCQHLRSPPNAELIHKESFKLFVFQEGNIT